MSMSRNHRAQIRRSPNRSAPEKAIEILMGGTVAHVAFCEKDQPFVVPFAYHFSADEPRRLYLHGAKTSRAMRFLEAGGAVAVAVTLLDALVYSRTAFDHTMNYASIVCFGHGCRVSGDAKLKVLDAMVQRYFAGRTMGTDYAPPTAQQMRGTSIAAIEIEEFSVKARDEGPNGPLDGLPHQHGSCGLVPAGERKITAIHHLWKGKE
jgi:hypothetical protein